MYVVMSFAEISSSRRVRARNDDVTALPRCAHLLAFNPIQLHNRIQIRAIPTVCGEPAMFRTSATIAQRATISCKPRAVLPPITSQKRHLSGTRNMSEQSKVQEYKRAGNRENKPPKHEAVYFKGLMSEKRAFGDFRTVLHTGLYSQIVAMEVPVGGEIGDEVRPFLHLPCISNSAKLHTY